MKWGLIPLAPCSRQDASHTLRIAFLLILNHCTLAFFQQFRDCRLLPSSPGGGGRSCLVSLALSLADLPTLHTHTFLFTPLVMERVAYFLLGS